MLNKIYVFISKLYEKNHFVLLIFLPFTWIYRALIFCRYWAYEKNIFKRYHVSVPVIIVGNITMGGSGKTPIIIAIANLLQKEGIQIGIISRGYKSKAPYYPYDIQVTSHADECGDEPLLLKRRLNCPIIIDPKRFRAAEFLLLNYPEIQIILSDDGLQHYALKREIEIAVISQNFYQTTQRLFPAGYLREPLSRLKKIDIILQCHERLNHTNPSDLENKIFPFIISPQVWVNLKTGEQKGINEFENKLCDAICAIAKPERFFETLKKLKINFNSHAFPDHYSFKENDLNFPSIILMTEKDAVKCLDFAKDNMWYLKIDVDFESQFKEFILNKLSL